MDSAELDQFLSEFEERLDRTRALYEQYFSGIEKLEPQIPRKDLERRLQVLRKQQIRNTALRFRFQTLVQRYNTLQQHWQRITREIENGTFKRDLQRAAARFGVDDAMKAAGGGRKVKSLEAVLERAGSARRAASSVDDSELLEGDYESLDADELLEDDDGPTPPPVVQKIRPAVYEIDEADAAFPSMEDERRGANAVASLSSNPGFGVIDEIPRGPEEVAEGSASLGQTEAAAADSLGKAVASRANALGGFRIPTSTKAAAEPIPASVAKPLLPHAAEGPKKNSGGLRLGGGARRADPSALNRIASVLGDDPTAAAPPVEPSAPSTPSDVERPKRSAPLLDSPIDLVDVSPGPPALEPRKPLLSRPIDIDVSSLPPLANPVPSKAATSLPPPVRGATALRPPSASPTTVLPPAQKPPEGSGQPPPKVVPVPSGSAPAPGALPPKLAATPDAGSGVSATVAPPERARAVLARPNPPTAQSSSPKPPSATGSADDARLREIYQQYVKTRRDHNESTAGITYEKLAESLRSQADKLKQKHSASRIDYEVVVKDGKTLIKPIVR
jgi:hypothetical protein